MEWKRRFGVENVIVNTEVDRYLMSAGFVVDKFTPRFIRFDGDCYEKIKNHDLPCLVLHTKDPDDPEHYLRLYINEEDAYFEVETSYRSFRRNYYREHNVKTIDEVDDLLNDMCRI
ncbi:hypothetical protein [Bacillus licheniformis]